jgi:hypothetical protein
MHEAHKPPQSNGQVKSRQPHGSYRANISHRAVVAAGLAEENGWPTKQAAALLCVNAAYVNLVRHLGAEDRIKLDRGELKLAHLHREHLRRLAARRAQRQQVELEAKQAELAALRHAEREAEAREIDRLLDCVGVDHFLDRFVSRFGVELLVDVLDVNLRRHGQDFVEVVVNSVGSERALRVLNRITTPHSIAAE